ncbi:MAG: acyl-CoA dehydrogenase family protein, partial [Alphaproteobacteria bacterium]|nr:acyl-CoA dehydrogenase family protein [Alphaproteobacteria bacterium]
MNAPVALTSRAASSRRAEAIAPTTRGLNYYDIDASLRALLPLYMAPDLTAQLAPHLSALGACAGTELYDLADTADRHEPVLHHRDAFGRDEEWIEFHPAYREMEKIAFGRFGLHAMCHRGDVLGSPEPLPPLAKYVFHYLFSQAEFGLLCPVNLTDSSSELVRRFGDEALKARYLDRMWSQDVGTLHRCAQFMTEKTGGSDVGAGDLKAVRDGDHWRLWGEKWFCSNVDAELAVLLARPEGAPAGGRGLGLFLMPKTLEDGSRNDYRIVRLKPKLGSRSMASGEITLEGATAYLIGEVGRGFQQMADMINMSRLSNGVRAAGLMRRGINESLYIARNRRAFGRHLIEMPLMQRQLLKMMLPTEQARSMFMQIATLLPKADAGDEAARKCVRILTPLIKFRACRDARRVTGDAMEVRGGVGYIEEWSDARLVRDAHLGSIWEGTSNIVALDIARAVTREQALEPLQLFLANLLAEA